MVVAKQDGKHITVNLFGHTERRGQVTRAFSLVAVAVAAYAVVRVGHGGTYKIQSAKQEWKHKAKASGAVQGDERTVWHLSREVGRDPLRRTKQRTASSFICDR